MQNAIFNAVLEVYVDYSSKQKCKNIESLKLIEEGNIYTIAQGKVPSAVARIFGFGGTIKIHSTLLLCARAAACGTRAARGTPRSG